jgi:hypothetical protein
VDADVTLKLWKAHFGKRPPFPVQLHAGAEGAPANPPSSTDYFYREEEWFVFPLTLHPDTAGRPHVLLTVEKLIEYIKTFEGVEFCTMAVSAHLLRYLPVEEW